MSDALLHERANRFVIDAMQAAGLTAELAPRDLPAQVVIGSPSGKALLVLVLVREAPHRRGGGGNLGLHWMTRDAPADFVALVDLSRRRGWLLPMEDLRARARPVAGGRLHLDWIVLPLSPTRSRVPDESEFEPYAFELALPELARRTSASP
jgi:hypothetical protein